MALILEQNVRNIKVPIHLPIPRFSELSHFKNIEYCIKQLKLYSDESNLVIGFWKARLQGIRHRDHMVIPKNEAERLRKEDSAFDYRTLDEFLQRKYDIENGKYRMSKLNKGLVIGLNLNY